MKEMSQGAVKHLVKKTIRRLLKIFFVNIVSSLKKSKLQKINRYN